VLKSGDFYFALRINERFSIEVAIHAFAKPPQLQFRDFQPNSADE
jgi:hypothetical protein